MKAAPLLALSLLFIAGCGGGGDNPLVAPTLTPGYYAGTASVTPAGAIAPLTFETRTFVNGAGQIRVFALGPTSGPVTGPNARRARRVTLASAPKGTTFADGSTVAATLDGVASSGEFTIGAEAPVALDFAGSAFRLGTTVDRVALPALGSGHTLASGTYAGELVSIGGTGVVDDWGDASGLLTTAPDGTALFTGNAFPAAGTAGPLAADLSADGTATADGFTGAHWSSDGSRFVLRLDRAGNTLFLVLTKR